jgi:cytochrome P450
MTAAQIDPSIITDSLSYTRPDEVRAVLDSLRKNDPVSYITPADIRPYWAVTRYEDIRYIESTPELFSAEPRAVIILEALEKVNMERFGDLMGVKSLVHMDGEQHMALRRITRDWFMPANVGKLRGHVRELAASFIDRMREMGGECDFAADIAFWYPLRVVLQLIGIPEEDEAHILLSTQKLFGPEGFANEEQDAMTVFLEAVQGMGEYFTLLAEDRRKNPKDDLASVLANATLNGEPLDPFTLTSYFILLATAGHDTTSASIAGGLHALLQFPEQHRALLDNPELIPAAADEMIRWVTPVKHFARTALADTELGGKKISKGDSLVMFFESANRDELAIENPEIFDIARKGSKHMAFGHGRHNCLGMHLAKMEIDAMMSQLLPQLESIELNGTPTYIPSHFVSGLSSLPVRYRFKD